MEARPLLEQLAETISNLSDRSMDQLAVLLVNQGQQRAEYLESAIAHEIQDRYYRENPVDETGV